MAHVGSDYLIDGLQARSFVPPKPLPTSIEQVAAYYANQGFSGAKVVRWQASTNEQHLSAMTKVAVDNVDLVIKFSPKVFQGDAL